MSEQKWLRTSLSFLRKKLLALGHTITEPTIARLLRQRKYSLRVNAKKQEASASHPQRNTQFEYIESKKGEFFLAGWPVISVDTKKKELIGNFKNAGAVWAKEAEAVNVHDFSSQAEGRAVPYGIYDLKNNQGTVYVGQSGDTPQFAVEAICQWWEQEGQLRYPHAKHLLILADAGGSNGCRPYLWKWYLQTRLAERFGLTVTVCHYPTGCSKWNPIEHRLFGPISLNWAGKPLRSWSVILNYLRGTTTKTGLIVRAFLLVGEYTTGQKITPAQIEALNLERHPVCPKWNYSLTAGLRLPAVQPGLLQNREVIF
jgi:hypothetical protein